MAIILAYEDSTHHFAHTTEMSQIKSDLDSIGNHWADLILRGIRQGKKPEILIDRSGSMGVPAIEGISRMDVARGLIASTARELREIAPDFDLNQIPVKSWGSAVYDEHEAVDPNTSPPTFAPKVTTLADFKQNELGTEILPHIPCTDGTDHSLWLNESNFPLVITDDLYNVTPEFVENCRNFDWLGDTGSSRPTNIVAIGHRNDRRKMHKLNRKIMNMESTTFMSIRNLFCIDIF